MAKLIEELVVVKLTKMVRDADGGEAVLSDAQREMVSKTLPALVEEVLGDDRVIVELADLE